MVVSAAILAFLQVSTPSRVPLLEDCLNPDSRITTLSQSDPVQIRFAIADAAKPCYAVTAQVDGKLIKGYVLGSDLKSVADFERERARQVSFVSTPPPAAPSASKPVVAATPQPVRRDLPVFADFSGRDPNGRPVSLKSQNGKLILVCFWSPRNTESLREAIVVNRLAGQLRQQGVKVVTVSLSRDRGLMEEAMEAITVPTVTDGSDIASRYGVTTSDVPKTFVLNEQHQILASGLHGQALENRVRSLAANPQ